MPKQLFRQMYGQMFGIVASWKATPKKMRLRKSKMKEKLQGHITIIQFSITSLYLYVIKSQFSYFSKLPPFSILCSFFSVLFSFIRYFLSYLMGKILLQKNNVMLCTKLFFIFRVRLSTCYRTLHYRLFFDLSFTGKPVNNDIFYGRQFFCTSHCSFCPSRYNDICSQAYISRLSTPR
jgi:hypothetical protein